MSREEWRIIKHFTLYVRAIIITVKLSGIKRSFQQASSVIHSTHIIIIIIFLLKNDVEAPCLVLSAIFLVFITTETHSQKQKRTHFENFIYVSFNDNVWANEYKAAYILQKKGRKSEPSSSPYRWFSENCLLTLTMKIWSNTIKK